MKQRQSIAHRVQTGLSNRFKVDPKVVLSSRILQLQQQELDQAIEQELNDNPALERVDTERESLDERELIRRIAHERQWQPTEDFESFAARSGNPDEATSWVEFLAAPVSLHDHLLAQLVPAVSAEQEVLARHVIDCVNANGYLDLPVEEIALLANSNYEETVQMIRMLQKCDPPGVGASGLRECLQLQLVDSNERIDLVARAILERHWEDLLQRKTNSISRRYRLEQSEVEEAFERIASLWPYPGEAFQRGSAAATVTAASSVSPDVSYIRTADGIRIEISGCDPSEFMINSWYKDRYREYKDQPAIADGEEKRHVREFVGRAMNFIKGVHQRRRTLRSIADFLLREQYGFVSTGSYDFLKPLTRIQVGRATGVHESTISRATMNKYVQIANGEVVPFEVFFRPALRVQKMIEEILINENPASPMSDREITEILNTRGIQVARRTVNKYREQIRALASHRRRTA